MNNRQRYERAMRHMVYGYIVVAILLLVFIYWS